VVVTFDQPGEYPIELIHREGTVNSDLQLFAAKGDESAAVGRDFHQLFYLVGDVYGGGLAVKSPRPCGVVFADRDGDGDVDHADFGVFQACYSGEGLPASYAACNCLDRDGAAAEGDGDIDTADLASFLDCYTGPAIPWTAEITPGCVPARP
jgi:hypothetical protein